MSSPSFLATVVGIVRLIRIEARLDEIAVAQARHDAAITALALQIENLAADLRDHRAPKAEPSELESILADAMKRARPC